MTSHYVVIGASPAVDTAVTIGPLPRTKTREAELELQSRGYVTEVCELFSLEEAFADLIEVSPAWDGEAG